MSKVWTVKVQRIDSFPDTYVVLNTRTYERAYCEDYDAVLQQNVRRGYFADKRTAQQTADILNEYE